MKVLHVIPSLSPARGGASKAALDMVAALRKIGVDAEIVCTNDDGAKELDVELGRKLEFKGVPVRFFSRYSPKFSGRVANAVREYSYSGDFRRWLDANVDQYQVVHVHALFSYVSSFAMRIARKHQIPYICHPIGSLETWSLQQSAFRKRVYLNLLDRKNIRGASLVHFTTDSEHQQALDVEKNLTALISPLGIEVEEPLPQANKKLRATLGLDINTPIILFIGRLHPKKGLELLLQALTNIESSNFHLVVAGSGNADYQDHLKQQVRKLKLENHVTFLGHVSGEQKRLCLHGADIFALTSYSENFGIAVVEALAASTPVLVSKQVGVAGLIAEQSVGEVCDVTVASITDGLNALLANPDRLPELGNNGRDYVMRAHNWPTIATQLQARYKDITLSS